VEGDPDIGCNIGDIVVIERNAVTKEGGDVALVVREWSILALSDAHVVQLKKYGEVACGWSTVDGPFEPVLEEIGNEPAMIEVGMGENHSVQFG